MSTAEIIDAFLRVLEISTSCIWPIITILLVLLFYSQIRDSLPGLSQRLKKAEIAGTKWEFSDVTVTALQDAIETGAEKYKDDPEMLVGFVRKIVNKIPSVEKEPPTINKLSLLGKSILWVDDKPINNVYETSILRRLGSSIVTANSTIDALSLIKRDNYGLVISDVQRFEENGNNPNAGYDLLESLKKIHKNVPLIFYTGSISNVDINKSRLAYGVATVPTKLINLVFQALIS